MILEPELFLSRLSNARMRWLCTWYVTKVWNTGDGCAMYDYRIMMKRVRDVFNYYYIIISVNLSLFVLSIQFQCRVTRQTFVSVLNRFISLEFKLLPCFTFYIKYNMISSNGHAPYFMCFAFIITCFILPLFGN